MQKQGSLQGGKLERISDTCIVPAWVFFNLTAKEGFIGEFINCLPCIFGK